MFVQDELTENHILLFDNVFKKASVIDRYGTMHNFEKLSYTPTTTNYGKTSVFFQVASTWNNMQNILFLT